MNMQKIIDAVRGFDGVLVITPQAGGPYPELSWGDAYFYYAPDGRMPERTQPYGTIITKNYPDDESSALDTPGRFRVNIHVGQGKADPLVAADAQPTDVDVFQPHPLYGTAGWVCVIDPAARTSDTVLALLRDAHESARARADRRARRG
ncbi:DUF6194 family protein [Microbacterium sp. KSW4-16]|uniref:DUF6194 domain-containing protein n=1 Tax=Microbacterium aurugineum TaxID=2851642 RepID=A0ABY4ITX2_9MICO|nr:MULTISPECIES: DUF6194 family protein [Microbacterium]MCK8467850.1 DUF6194 family protein [Microbacterium aurugineum]QEA27842.1 hypothetical protein FGL91_04270 [Microbacterium sp. CBA3102]TCJ22508.1 hypothetical protein E0W80_13665 [Microbacterium sp. PI-1]UPL16261.1 hypothetical protein KV397_00065 [Microbacterium aurugineum]